MSEKKSRKRWKRRALILLGSFFILLAAALAFLHTRQAGDWLLGIADRQLIEKTGYSIKAQNTHFSPFSLTVVLNEVTLQKPPSENSPLQKIHAERLEVQVPWSLLMGKGLHLKKLLIAHPTIEVTATNPQPTSLNQTSVQESIQPQTPVPTPLIPPFRIDFFELTDGKWRTKGQDTQVGFLLEKVKAAIQYDPQMKSHLISVDIGNGDFTLNGSSYKGSKASARARFHENNLTIDSLKLASQTSKLDMSGQINLLGPEPAYQIKADSTLTIEEWLPLNQTEQTISGSVILTADISGTGQNAAYAGKISTKNLHHRDLGPLHLAGTYHGNTQVLELSDLVLKTLGGQIDLASTLSLDKTSPSSVTCNWTGIETQLLAFLLPQDIPLITAVTTGQLSASWTAPAIEGLKAEARITFEPSAPLAPLQDKMTLSPDGTLSLIADEGRLSTQGSLSLAGSTCAFSGTMDKDRKLKAELNLHVQDLPVFTRALNLANLPYLPSRSEAIQLSAQVSGTLNRIDLKAQVDAAGISWLTPTLEADKIHLEIDASRSANQYQVKFKTKSTFLPNPYSLDVLSLNGRITPDEFVLEDLNLASEKGDITGSFAFFPHDQSFQAALKGNQIPLPIAGPFLPLAKELRGTADFQIDGRGSIEKPGFNLSIKLKDLAYKKWSLPLIELNARSDRMKTEATLSIPALMLKADAGMVLKKPYRIEGKLAVNEDNLQATFVCPLLQMEDFAFDSRFSVLDQAISPSLLSAWPDLPPAKGSIAGTFWLKGKPSDISRMQSGLEINRLELNLADLQTVLKEKAVFSLQNNIISLNPLTLTADGSQASLSGQLSLSPTPQLNAHLDLQSDLSRFAHLMPAALFGGSLHGALDINGPLNAPEIMGQADIRDLFIRLRDFPLTMTAINGQIEFRKKEIVLSGFSGAANGGTFTINGSIVHEDLNHPQARNILINAQNLSLSYPEGMRTTVNADLAINGAMDHPVLSGEANIVRGLFRKNIHPGIELINLARYVPPPTPEDIPAPFRNLQLDLRLNTLDPLRINNNMADIELETRLSISGTPAFTLFSGHVRNNQGGQVLLGGRTYTVEKLLIEYAGTPVTDFSIDVIAHTQVHYGNELFDITLHLSGPMSKPEYSLSYTPTAEHPSLSNQDLSFLLLTGKMPSDFSSSAIETLGGQMLTYFATPFTSPITEGLKKLLKAEDVVIEPLIIASETDPGARFTFRKRVSERALFTYSTDITRNQRQIWKLDYDLLRSLQIGAYRKDDGSYGASFKHSFQFGGHTKTPTKGSAAQETLVLGDVTWGGDLVFPEKRLVKLTKRLRPNQPFSYSELHTSVEKMLDLYRKKGYVNVVVSPQLTSQKDSRKDILFNISAGKPAQFVFRGDSLPKKMRTEVTESWLGDFPVQANLDESKILLLHDLRQRKYTGASVEAAIEEQNGLTTYVFNINKGPRTRLGSLNISGAGPLSEKAIKKTVSTYLMAPTRSPWNLLIDEASALEALRRAYTSLGYLKAVITPPQFIPNPTTRALDIMLAIKPGPCTLIHSITLTGWKSVTRPELQKSLTLSTQTPFNPTRLQEDQNALITLYRNQGFGDVEIKAQAIERKGTNSVSILFSIREGTRRTLSGVVVSGNEWTSETFIRREAALVLDTPITPKTIAQSKKRLYDSGIFKSVNLTHYPADDNKGVGDTMRIEVEERPPLSLAYGLRFNSEDKFEGHGELTFANLLGSGRRGFVSYRKNRRQGDLRASLLAPYMFGIKLNTLLSLYSQKETREQFVTATTGFSVQQEIRLPLKFSLSYLYRFNRIHTYETENSGPFPFDFTINLSEVGLSLLHDSRDDKLNPRSGSYFTASLTYAPQALGADLPYISFFTQYTQAVKIGPHIIWSGSLRLGMADAYEQDLIPSKRFFAGGGNSVRGYRQDSIGPRDPYLDRPSGGEAVLIVNNELRFPIFSMISGALFYDFGNVYGTVNDLTLSDLRHGAGLGLRLNSPVGLIRLDLGFNLKPRPTEPRSVLFFSLGQAF